jgi:hypothetical protein
MRITETKRSVLIPHTKTRHVSMDNMGLGIAPIESIVAISATPFLLRWGYFTSKMGFFNKER